jgi:RNA polymerase sigma-70 factor (ECF subfamily)
MGGRPTEPHLKSPRIKTSFPFNVRLPRAFFTRNETRRGDRQPFSIMEHFFPVTVPGAKMTDTFGQLLLRTLPELRAYAMALTRNRSAADDLLQEAALKAWQGRGQFQPDSNFRAWFYRIVRNEYLTTVRKGKRRPTADIADTPEHFLAAPANQDEKIAVAEILRAFSALPVNHREVLTLVCAQDFTYEEAAEAMGCTVGTIKSKLWRARAAMHKGIFGSDRPKPAGKVTQPTGTLRHAALQTIGAA